MKSPFLFSILRFVRNFQLSEFSGIRSDTQFYNPAPQMCSPVPFDTQSEITTSYDSRYITNTPDAYNAFAASNLFRLYAANGVENSTPVGVWVQSATADRRTAISQFVKLEHGVINGQPSSATDQWVWISFRLTTYSRSVNPHIGRRRRSTFDDDLAHALKAAEATVEKLKTELTLPNGATLAESTKTTHIIKQLTATGEAAGTCTDGKCICNSGFENDGNGGCVLKCMLYFILFY